MADPEKPKTPPLGEGTAPPVDQAASGSGTDANGRPESDRLAITHAPNNVERQESATSADSDERHVRILCSASSSSIDTKTDDLHDEHEPEHEHKKKRRHRKGSHRHRSRSSSVDSLHEEVVVSHRMSILREPLYQCVNVPFPRSDDSNEKDVPASDQEKETGSNKAESEHAEELVRESAVLATMLDDFVKCLGISQEEREVGAHIGDDDEACLGTPAQVLEEKSTMDIRMLVDDEHGTSNVKRETSKSPYLSFNLRSADTPHPTSETSDESKNCAGGGGHLACPQRSDSDPGRSGHVTEPFGSQAGDAAPEVISDTVLPSSDDGDVLQGNSNSGNTPAVSTVKFPCWHDLLKPIEVMSKYIQTECWKEASESSAPELVVQMTSGHKSNTKVLSRSCSLQISMPDKRESEESSGEELDRIFAAYSAAKNEEISRADVKGMVHDRSFKNSPPREGVSGADTMVGRPLQAPMYDELHVMSPSGSMHGGSCVVSSNR